MAFIKLAVYSRSGVLQAGEERVFDTSDFARPITELDGKSTIYLREDNDSSFGARPAIITKYVVNHTIAALVTLSSNSIVSVDTTEINGKVNVGTVGLESTAIAGTVSLHADGSQFYYKEIGKYDLTHIVSSETVASLATQLAAASGDFVLRTGTVVGSNVTGNIVLDSAVKIRSASTASTYLSFTGSNAALYSASDLALNSGGNTTLFASGNMSLENSGNFALTSSGTSILYSSADTTITSAANMYLITNKLGIDTISPEFQLDVNGDIRIRSASKLYFGGTGAADNDTNLYRSAADTLKTDDAFVASISAQFNANGSFKIGKDSANTEIGAVVIGQEAGSGATLVVSSKAVLIGYQSGKGSSVDSTSILAGTSTGFGSVSIGAGSIGIGELALSGAVAYGANAIAIGELAVVGTLADSTAIGRSATATGADAIAFGRSSVANSTGSIAIGTSTVSNSSCTIIGYTATSGGAGVGNTVIGYASSGSSGNYSVALGANVTQGGGAQQPISIGSDNNQNSDYTISIGSYYTGVITNKLAIYDIAIGTYGVYNSTVASGGRNIFLGCYHDIGYTAGLIRSVMIGFNVRSYVDNTASKGYNAAIGSWTQIGSSTVGVDHGILVFGSGDGTNWLTNNENNSMIIGMNDQYESFKLYKDGNIVLNGANAASVVSGTHTNTGSTNTIVIPNGTIPTAAVANAIQISSKDTTGALSGLSLYTEAIPIAIGIKANTEYYPVFINGVEKFIALVA